MIYLFFNATVFAVTSPRQTIQIPSSNLSALQLYLSVHPKLILFSFTFDFVFIQSFSARLNTETVNATIHEVMRTIIVWFMLTLRCTEWHGRYSFDYNGAHHGFNKMDTKSLLLLLLEKLGSRSEENLTLKAYKYKCSFEQREIICH